MSLSPLVLGALPDKPAFVETAVYQITGLLIVFIVLGALWLLMELSGFVFRRRDANARVTTGQAEPKDVALSPVSETRHLGDDISAVIAAAVHVSLGGKKYRVVSVSPLIHPLQAGAHGHPWAVEGRREIFSSHKTR